ncbi:MAG TPA: hypothetical protein VKF32_06775, partial [Thermoanaerobaculia bacterium]|nr:hypothetical protein [Thermoanaerobaculia bacterium]
GAALKDGALHVEIALDDGRMPIGFGYALEARGRPLLALDAAAREGRVRAFCASVPAGSLVLRGSGLRPDIRIDELAIGDDGAVSSATFRGVGFWSRLVLSLLGGLGRKEIGKLRFHTDLKELMRGDLLVVDEKAAAKTKKAPPAAAPPAEPRPEEPSLTSAFLRLVDHVRIEDSRVTAFPGKELAFGDAFRLETGSGEPVSLVLNEVTYRPEAASGVSAYRAEGTLDGAFGKGELLWEADRVVFASGSLQDGRFLFEDGFASRSELGASRLALELTSGRFRLPSGILVELAAPSRFAARELALGAGGVRALVDLDLTGKTGEIARQGSRIELTDAHVTTAGLRLANGRADGDVSLAFDYRLVHPLAVSYPMPEVNPRRVDLEFRGPFRADLHLSRVGAGSQDAVTGRYVFSVNWAPIERAAFEAIRARWVQDVTTLHKVSFEIEPVRFAPCGEECFLARFRFVAAKVGSKRISMRCAPEGRATLVLDKEAKAFVLKGVKTEPHCEGLLGKLVNLVAPLFAKTYDDMVLFRMPEGLPFTIERVRGEADELEISGSVVWREEPPSPAQSGGGPPANR